MELLEKHLLVDIGGAIKLMCFSALEYKHFHWVRLTAKFDEFLSMLRERGLRKGRSKRRRRRWLKKSRKKKAKLG